jgi:hypothetical protein
VTGTNAFRLSRKHTAYSLTPRTANGRSRDEFWQRPNGEVIRILCGADSQSCPSSILQRFTVG